MEEEKKIDQQKYPGYRPDDTRFDEHHRSQGLMTNHEFFTSNGPGGFYEGMEWDEKKKEWVLNAENQRREREAKEKWYCFKCEAHKSFCECNDQSSYNDNDF